jgi:transcriptional regulator with XRE-family HTH domain
MALEPGNNDAVIKIAGSVVASPDPGQALKAWREKLGIRQVALAKEMKISPSVLSDYESGRRPSPGVQFVRKYVDALVVLDQVDIPETGVVTQRILAFLADHIRSKPEMLVLADSRRSLRGFPPVVFKMNAAELAADPSAACAAKRMSRNAASKRCQGFKFRILKIKCSPETWLWRFIE